MVNETMVDEYNEKRIQELETTNAELLEALEEYQLTPPDKRVSAEWHTPWYERVTATIEKAKGTAP